VSALATGNVLACVCQYDRTQRAATAVIDSIIYTLLLLLLLLHSTQLGKYDDIYI